MKKELSSISFVFFGTPGIAVIALQELKNSGLVPSLIITQEDKPVGRTHTLTPPPVKKWAEENNIPVLQPKTLRDDAFVDLLKKYEPVSGWDVFIVVAYGKIIPLEIIEYPKQKTLNLHPSLLPKLRGPAPIQGAILNEEKTGVSIMKLDQEVDHGPILSQEEVPIEPWPPYREDLEKALGEHGGKLLAKTIPPWIEGALKEIPQDHKEATFTKKITKEDALIDLKNSPDTNLRKIRAYAGEPNAFAFFNTKSGKKRVLIKRARIENGSLILERVIPEGKKEMDFEDFKRGLSILQ